nr:ribonuclease H-like domain-containing protein [Tanacetum cinerariifolium]
MSFRGIGFVIIPEQLNNQEVILNGDSPIPIRVIEGVVQPVAPTTAEQRLARKNELKARVRAVASVSAASAKVPVSALPNVDTLSDVVIYSFFANIKLLKLDVQLRDNPLVVLRKKYEKAEQERDELKLKLEKFQTSSKNLSQLLASQTNDKTGLGYDTHVFTSSMFDCDEMFSSETDESLLSSPIYDRYQSGEGYHVVPPPYTGTFMPPKPDLVFHNAPTVNETVHAAFNVELSPTHPDKDLSYTHRPSALIIEDWVSDSEDESKAEPLQNYPSFVQPTEQVKTPRPFIKPIEYPIPAANLKTAIPKPKTYRNDKNRKACFVYQLLTQPHVTRLRPAKTVVTKPYSPPRRNINHRPSPNPSTFPQKVTTANVSHVNVVKGVQGNWGNPQHALKDKGFIDSGCSRHMIGNMFYLTEFEEINGRYVAFGGNPKGGKILSKGKIRTDTECIVLSHEFKLPDENQVLLRDEASLIFKTFISGIKNQLSLKVKIIRSNNGTEFKNHDLNKFYGMKGIKREFSVPRTPQQNEIVERKNRTLIEVGRTMLADSLLPISFWAEAVNTACYVQDRVLVTKPHNKTPYELLLGRTPSIGFMRPFGCLVTILNTIDPLGKFDRKANEGLSARYYVSSKAFRVFNSRTRIVQETLHINLLENKPNVAGSGPTWLFAREDNVQQYVLFPLWSSGSKDPQNTDGDDTFKVKEPEFEGRKPESIVHVSPSSSAKTKKNMTRPKERIKVNAASTPVPTVRQISTYSTNTFSVVGLSNTFVSPTLRESSYMDPSQYPDDPNMPALEDITYSNDEEDVGAEADFTNLKTTITVCHILTTKVHKDHPITQIIGDLSSATQTRNMTRMVKDIGGLTQINNEDFYTCMFACFISQEEPKREEGIDYEEVFAPVARIEAIRLFLAYASFMGFMVYQMDVKSAFLYGTIKKEVYKESRSQMGIIISQDKYVAKILRKFSLTTGKSASTPIDTEKPLLKDPDGEDVDVHTYRSMIGSLMYLTSSRPDIMFAVCACARFQATPKASHLHALKSIFRYLKVLPWIQLSSAFQQVAPTPPPSLIAQPSSPPQQQQPSQSTTISMDLLNNLLETCTALTRRVKNLEQDKIDQALEILKLNKRVRKLEKKKKLKASGLQRLKKVRTAQRIEFSAVLKLEKKKKLRVFGLKGLRKVGTTQRIESSADTVMDDHEDASKQRGIIDYLDADKDVTLEEVKVEKNAKDDEPEPAELQEVIEVVTTTKLMTEVVTAAAPITAAIITAAPTAARRIKGVVIRDPEETATPSTIVHTEPKSKDKGIRIMVEEPKPLKKQARIEQDKAYARELEVELNKNINWDDVIEQVKEKGKQYNVVLRYQALKRKPQTEAQARKNMMVYLKIMAGFKMDYFKGMSYDDIRPIFKKYFNLNVAFLEKSKEHLEEEESKALKRISESLEEKAAKKQKLDEEIVQERFASSKPKNFSNDFLLTTLKYMFEKPDVEAQVWKNQIGIHSLAKVKSWRLLESCGVHIITFITTQMILLVERRYPLTRFTLDQMLDNVRLEVEEESEVSLELLRFIRQQQQEGYRPE